MTVPVLAFFNNRAGVGKTSLVYHLSWMFADQGRIVLAADLDPQANLTAAFVDEDRMEQLWPEAKAHCKTAYGALAPLLRGVGDILSEPHCEEVDERLFLVPGDLALARFEDELSVQWLRTREGQERALRVISVFWRLVQSCAAQVGADLILLDMAPHLGALNRAALLAADYLAVPLEPDRYSVQSLRNVGTSVRQWRDEWQDRLKRNPSSNLDLPAGSIRPIGYLIMQHAVRLNRPLLDDQRWSARIAQVYAQEMLENKEIASANIADDPNCLGLIRPYRSLMLMAQEARKPIFHLLSADGAIGSHAQAALDARHHFSQLAHAIARQCQLDPPNRMER